MRQSDIEWIKTIVLGSGIGTMVQRQAICTRIQDRFNENKQERVS